MSRTHIISSGFPSKKINAAVHRFFVAHPPAQVSRHLRIILLDYIHSQLDPGLPDNFHLYLEEFYDLFELLDTAALEYPLTQAA